MLTRIWYHTRREGITLPLGLVSLPDDQAQALIRSGHACDAKTDPKTWPKLQGGKTHRYKRRDWRAENEIDGVDPGPD